MTPNDLDVKTKRLAEARIWALTNGYDFEWRPEPEAWDDFLGDVPMEDGVSVEYVLMRDSSGTVVQSLGGVVFGPDDQREARRTFEAELALEELDRRHETAGY